MPTIQTPREIVFENYLTRLKEIQDERYCDTSEQLKDDVYYTLQKVLILAEIPDDCVFLTEVLKDFMERVDWEEIFSLIKNKGE